MAINNMRDMRNHALATLAKLDNRSIDIKEAQASAALYSSVMATIKLELEHCKMLEQKPQIAFLESNRVLDVDIDEDNLQITEQRRIK
jgi:hypothetical protein